MTGSEMILWTVSLVIGILVTPGECVGISQSGVSVHLGHRDRKMNVQYFNDLRRDIGAADMNALMITASAENAACSLTRCSHMRRQRQDEEANMYFVTCLFSPATDMAKPPFSKGRKCSRCPVYSGCRRGLCSSLGKRFSNKKKYPSPDKNRVVSLPGAKDVTPIKGSLIQGHRYLDAEGNIRIRTIPKYLAQTGRGPSYIYRPPRTRLHSQRPTRLNDRESQGRGAVRGVPAQGARGPMGSTDKFQLTQVHNTLRGTQSAELSWSNHLERWARYVIRCEIEYPGPIDTFTNFGKVDRTSRVYNIIYDWGAEGSDVNQRQNVGCRTPDDREKCNHNSIIRNPFIRNFACASLDCGSKTQLTCIYK